MATGLGSSLIRLGTHYPGDGILDSGNHLREHFEATPFRIAVIPEPGSSILLGLGLAALGVRRRASGSD